MRVSIVGVSYYTRYIPVTCTVRGDMLRDILQYHTLPPPPPSISHTPSTPSLNITHSLHPTPQYHTLPPPPTSISHTPSTPYLNITHSLPSRISRSFELIFVAHSTAPKLLPSNSYRMHTQCTLVDYVL